MMDSFSSQREAHLEWGIEFSGLQEGDIVIEGVVVEIASLSEAVAKTIGRAGLTAESGELYSMKKPALESI